MKILVYGSNKFSDYDTFTRAVVVAIDNAADSIDNKLDIYTAGPYKVNQFTAEFVNKTESFFKQKGIKSRFYRVLKNDVVENFDKYGIDSVVYLSTKNERAEIFDTVISTAEQNDIPVNIYKV
jgi:imidazole glycerol phosphate synthase subunit HisF